VSPIGFQVKRYRVKRGLSQVALSKLARVRQPTISDIERGTTKRIDLGVLERLARALGVSAAELLIETPAKSRRARRAK
jgi:transcriptional regulator with XRE-family HTH domain